MEQAELLLHAVAEGKVVDPQKIESLALAVLDLPIARAAYAVLDADDAHRLARAIDLADEIVHAIDTHDTDAEISTDESDGQAT